MKIILLTISLMLFYIADAQIIDTTINKDAPKIEYTDSNSKSFSGNYTFTSKVFEKGKKEKIYTREVNVYRENITEEITNYSLYCIKYGFDDPEFQPFLKKIAYLFDEIIVSVDLNGKITSIDSKNLTEIKQRWLETKSEILKNNSGQVLFDYLQEVENLINNDSLLFDFLQGDNMYGMLFNGVANRETQSQKVKKIKSLETIRISSERPIADERYFYQKGLFIGGYKKEKRTGKERTKLEYEIFYNGKEKW